MVARKLDYDIALSTLWGEAVYTEARLLSEPLTCPYAPAFGALVERVEVEERAQRALRRKEIVAQAGVDRADDGLDDGVNETDRALRVVVRDDREDKRYTRYIKRAPSLIIRMGLETELEAVRNWPESLKTEAEPQLAQMGTLMEERVKAGDDAIKARNKAMTDTADHRVRSIVRLVDDVNAARLSLFGQLVSLVEPNKLPRDWPDRFFRHETTRKPGPPSPV